MAGTLNVTKAMDAIKVAVDLVSGIQGNYQGYKVFDESENENEDIRALTDNTQGIFNFDIVERIGGKATEVGQLRIAGELAVNVPKDTTQDLTSPYEIAERVFRAAQLESNFATNTGVGPAGGKWAVRDKEAKESIMYFDYELNYTVGPIC